MLQLTLPRSPTNTPHPLNPHLSSKNKHLLAIKHRPAALVPGLFVAQDDPEVAGSFETIKISPPILNQESKTELVMTTRRAKKHQISFQNRRHSFPHDLTQLDIELPSPPSPESAPKDPPALSKVHSWHNCSEISLPPKCNTHRISQDSPKLKPISRSMLLDLEVYFEEEEQDNVSQKNEALNISKQEIEQQQFKDLRQSSTQLQQPTNFEHSSVDIEIFSPLNSVSRQVFTSKQQFLTSSRLPYVKQTLTRRVEDNTSLQLMVFKDSSALNALWPKYYLRFAKHEAAIMAAKRTSNTLSTTYIVSTTPRDFQENSGYYLGKIKSNLKGNVFNVYGPGLNPKNAHERHVIPRQLIATITCQRAKLGSFPSVKLYMKRQQQHYYLSFPEVKMYGQQISLDTLYLQHKQKIDLYSSQVPFQSCREEKMSLSRNLSNKTPSRNDLILEHSLTKDQAIVLSKIDPSTYNLSISSPLSPLVSFALALALSSFNFKP